MPGDAPGSAPARFKSGARVQHPTRGDGTVHIVTNDSRSKPYKVKFDNGEVHQYSEESAAKLKPCRSKEPEIVLLRGWLKKRSPSTLAVSHSHRPPAGLLLPACLLPLHLAAARQVVSI